MAGNRKRADREERRPPDDPAAAYNPLTGNRQFFRNLGDGTVPEDERTVRPPAHEGAGQRFRPRKGGR